MFILADTEKNSSKSFSSLNELKEWINKETANVGLVDNATTAIKKAIDLLMPFINYKQTNEYVDSMKAIRETNTETNEIKQKSEVKPITPYLESEGLIDYMKKPTDRKRQNKFLQSSRWISPEDAGYNSEITKDIDTLFTNSGIPDHSLVSEVTADHEGNAEEILDRFKDLEKMKKSKITLRMKELEDKVAKWMWENCLENRTNLGLPYIDGNVYWNLLLHSKGNKKILGTIPVPKEILNILKDSELEDYASTYRNTENTTYLCYVSEKRLKPGMFEEFNDLSTYIHSLNIRFQNVRAMDVAYQCYVGHYEDSIRMKNLEDWILAFVGMRLKKENKDASVKSSVLYTHFLEWLEGLWCNEVCLETIELRLSVFTKLKAVCTQKTFSSILKSVANMTSVRKADGVYWTGVALTDSSGSFAPFESENTLNEVGTGEMFAPVLENTPIIKTEEQKIKHVLNDPLQVHKRIHMRPDTPFNIKTSVPGKDSGQTLEGFESETYSSLEWRS